jgi:hypothetical protein
MLTVFGRREVNIHFAVTEMSHPSAGKMVGGKNRDSDKGDDAEYFYPCRHARCRFATEMHAGIAGGLVM